MLWTPQSIVTVYSHNSKYFVKLFSHWIYCYNSVDKHLLISKQCNIVFQFTTLYFILQHCECHCRYCDLECRQKIFTSQHNNQLSNTTTARKKLKQTLYSSLQLNWSSNCNLDWDSIVVYNMETWPPAIAAGQLPILNRWWHWMIPPRRIFDEKNWMTAARRCFTTAGYLLMRTCNETII